MAQVQHSAVDMLRRLMELFPEQTPRTLQTEWQQGHNAGIMRVIDYLKEELGYNTAKGTVKEK